MDWLQAALATNFEKQPLFVVCNAIHKFGALHAPTHAPPIKSDSEPKSRTRALLHGVNHERPAMNPGEYLDNAAKWLTANKTKIVLVAIGVAGAIVLTTVF